MVKLVVNADDFGLTANINRGIVNSHVNGILTSTSIMANGRAFEEAVALSEKYPKLGIGIHLSLVDLKPVLDPAEVPTLVNSEGCLYENYRLFFKNYLLRKVKMEDIRKELTSQVEKVRQSGIKISHIDSHQHIHIMPGILNIVIELAKKYHIHWVRNCHDVLTPASGVGPKGLSFLGKLGKEKILRNNLGSSDYFLGTRYTGKMKKTDLLNMLQQLPEGMSEIMCHPGDDDPGLAKRYSADWQCGWQDEQDALTANEVAETVKERGIALVNYNEL